jgi:hypothetical protein
VQSVNGEIGTVVLDASDVGALAGTAIFEDLADVEFTSLADGQTVAFDATVIVASSCLTRSWANLSAS